MPLCVLAVHQLRFFLAFGDAAPSRLAREGHGYISAVEPLALLATAIAAGGLIGRAARAWHRAAACRAPIRPDCSAAALDSPRRRAAVLRTWLLCAGALLAIYCAQELLEGAVAGGHAGGLAGVFGNGGWIAVPVALATGGALASAVWLADALVSFVSRRGGRGRHPARRSGSLAQPHVSFVATDWRLHPASGVAAGRAPPCALSFSRS